MKSTAGGAGVSRTGMRVPLNRTFERDLAQLEAMSGHAIGPEEIDRLRKALANQNNYLVAKAARIVSDHALTVVLPEVLAAFDRFFDDPVKSDPQCWAKNALAKALVKLECHDAAVYVRGLRHTQDEPAWGGQSDTAGALRGTCTHALVACEGLSNAQLLNYLIEALVDRDKTVRMEAARAIGHVGGVSAALLLKLRILLRKDEPEVLGACFSAILDMDEGDRAGSIALIAEFLDAGEESAGEAAFALAETHDPAALTALIGHRRKGTDAWFTSIIDRAIVLTRLPEAMDFLLTLLEKDPRQASSILEAISQVHQSPEIMARARVTVERADSERAFEAFRKFFPESSWES